MTLSVVVPTRDRPEKLARCLEALAAQDAPAPLEIVVVDDGSRDGHAVAEAATQASARLVRIEGLGLGAARNAGIRAASGTVVLFTDDDCRPALHWAVRLAAALERGAGAVGGETLPGDPANPYAQASEAICAQARDELGFLVGNNLGCRRELALQLPFDETSPVPAAEDREWSRRVAAAGHTLVHVPDALVYHEPDLDLGRFWAQHVRYGRGAAWLARKARVRRQPVFYATLVASGFRRGVRDGILTCVAQAATAAGFLAERRR